MTKSTKMLIAAAAMTGLLAGATAVKAATTVKSTFAASSKATKVITAKYGQKAVTLDDTDKHDCKGKNDCKGKGGCKTDSHECKGKNDCKGKGGCKSTDKL